MSQAWRVMLATAFLGALTFWILRQLDEEQTSSLAQTRHEPDYYFVEMTRRTMNREGELQNVLTAENVYHFPDDDTTELAHPHMEIYNGDPNPWQVVAERGLIKSDNEIVFLQGRVEIWRVNSEGQRQFEILTSEFRVFPKVQYGESDNATTIRGSSNVTKTRGFRANFEHNRLELLERVRSRYEKPPPA